MPAKNSLSNIAFRLENLEKSNTQLVDAIDRFTEAAFKEEAVWLKRKEQLFTELDERYVKRSEFVDIKNTLKTIKNIGWAIILPVLSSLGLALMKLLGV